MARKKLRNRRIEKGLTQEQVANMVNICRPFYCELEAGRKNCKFETWLKIANVLEIGETDLVFYIKEGLEKGA